MRETLRCRYVRYLLERPNSKSIVFCNTDLQARMLLQQINADMEEGNLPKEWLLRHTDRMLATPCNGFMKFITADLGRPHVRDDETVVRPLMHRCAGYELNAIFTDELHPYHSGMIGSYMNPRIRRL